MAPIKGFLFDLDGVIVDTAKFHFKAWQRLAAELGIHFDEADNEKLKGVSRKESLEKILEWGHTSLDPERFEAMMAKKNDWYLEFVKEMSSDEALPGAKDFLAASLALKLRVGLGSASKNAELILNLLQIHDSFECIIDGTKITRSKPDPQVFSMGAEFLGIEPQSIVVFEDSQAGIEAARAGGFRSVGIGDPKILADAEIVISGLHQYSPSEIINKLNF
jgi:beta-phosphoglucomutase